MFELPDNWREFAKYYALIYILISVGSVLVAEAYKKIMRGIKSYKTGDDKREIKIHPAILFAISGAVVLIGTILFDFIAKVPLFAHILAPIFVFSLAIIGYETIIKNVIDIFDLLGSMIKKFIIGFKKSENEEKLEIQKIEYAQKTIENNQPIT